MILNILEKYIIKQLWLREYIDVINEQYKRTYTIGNLKLIFYPERIGDEYVVTYNGNVVLLIKEDCEKLLKTFETLNISNELADLYHDWIL